MRKSQVDPMHIIILFIILAVVAGIVIYMFTTQIGKEKGITEKQIGGLDDTDGDGVANFLDKCPNTPTSEIKQVDTLGCGPSEQK